METKKWTDLGIQLDAIKKYGETYWTNKVDGRSIRQRTLMESETVSFLKRASRWIVPAAIADLCISKKNKILDNSIRNATVIRDLFANLTEENVQATAAELRRYGLAGLHYNAEMSIIISILEHWNIEIVDCKVGTLGGSKTGDITGNVVGNDFYGSLIVTYVVDGYVEELTLKNVILVRTIDDDKVGFHITNTALFYGIKYHE